jgi:hypothetical protein
MDAVKYQSVSVDSLIDTVEVWGSSPHVPTISFQELTSILHFGFLQINPQ